MQRLLVTAVIATLVGSAWAEIFKSVDENGNVVFSDLPPAGDAAEPVTVEPVNSYDTAQATPPSAPTTGAAATIDADYYGIFRITDPATDTAIRDNAGNVAITFTLMPGLRGDHRLQLLLDGTPAPATLDDSRFQLTNVDRGTHTAVGRIVDGNGDVVTETAPITFHMLRAFLRPTPAPSN